METIKNTHFVYVIKSDSSGMLYIGVSANPQRRLNEHNNGRNTSTRKKGPWKLLYTHAKPTYHEAITLERRLKRWKKRDRILRWIERNQKV